MTSLTSFFHFCAGSHPSILKRTPTDQQKYASIGATVFFTGVFAAIAGGFALYTVFHSYWVAVPFAILWGLMIFNLDRYIVMSIKKKGSRWKEVGMALPRFALALVIALVIAKPLELRLFASEIHAELVSMEQEVYRQQESTLRSRYETDIGDLKAELATIQQGIEDKRAIRDELIQLAAQEADGTGGSGLRNLGPIYKLKRANADYAQAELDELIAKTATLRAHLQSRIVATESEVSEGLASLEKGRLDGFAAQLDALGRLGRKSSAIYWASIFVTLLFIAIEIAPLLVKLMSEKGPYDYRLSQHELLASTTHDTYAARLQSSASAYQSYTKEVSRYETLQKIAAEKDLIKAVIAEELKTLQKETTSWRQYKKVGRRFGYF